MGVLSRSVFSFALSTFAFAALSQDYLSLSSRTELDAIIRQARNPYVILYFRIRGDSTSAAMTPDILLAAKKMGAPVYDVEVDSGPLTVGKRELIDALSVPAYPFVGIYRQYTDPAHIRLVGAFSGYRADIYNSLVNSVALPKLVRPVERPPARPLNKSPRFSIVYPEPPGSRSESKAKNKSAHSTPKIKHGESSDDEHGDHYDGGPMSTDSGAPYTFSSFKNRAEAFQDPYVISALNKCIACHIMNPYNDPKRDAKGTNPGRLITLESLQDALVGEDGTFHRKRLREISDGDARHIHFSARDLTAIKNLYLTEEKAVEPFERRLAPDIVQKEVWENLRKTFPSGRPSTRSEAIRNPVLTYAAMRCVLCHTDPRVTDSGANVGEVDTLMKMRRVFLTLDKDTLHAMLKKGYETTQQYHIQDVEYVDKYPDGTERKYQVPLRSALEELVRLPVE